MNHEFATAGRILFGPGTIQEVPRLASESGKRVLIVTGRSRERAAHLVESLRHRNIETALFHVIGEPTTDIIYDGLRAARSARCDLVIAIGGGSAIDTGKIISALLSNKGDLMDYLEVVGRGQPLQHPAAPFIAIPTTAGTGAEVTRNAVVGSPPHRVKVSMRHHFMLPRYAVVDPELTYDLPRALTATSGLDALTQLMEVFVSDNASPLTDAVCREGLRHVRCLRTAYDNGADKTARADMAWAALLSGMALANARLGAVHGLSGPLGGMFSAPHGAICARLLPYVTEANIKALRTRDRSNQALERYREMASILTGRENVEIEDGLAWVGQLCGALEIPPLRNYGVSPDAFDEIIIQSRKSSSMKGNPVVLDSSELRDILQKAL